MGRKILAVITAMITAVAIIWVAYMVGTLFPATTPSNLEYVREADVRNYAATYPPLAFIAILIGYAAAAFAGGFIATKMGRRWSPGMTLAVIVGILLTIGSLLTVAIWPQPIWFVIVGILLFVPLSMVGYKLAHRVT